MQAPLSASHPRSPYTALLLSLGMPGLGQIYLGRAADGLVLCLVPNLLLLSCFLFTNALGVLLSLIMMFCFYFYATLNAYFEAKKLTGPAPLKRYNNPYVYLLLWVLFLTFTLGLSNPNTLLGKQVVVRAFLTRSGAMEPTLLRNELIFADKFGSVIATPPEYGDLVVTRNPELPHRFAIRRVIGKPGDRIRIVGGMVFVNGAELSRFPDPNPPPISRRYHGRTQTRLERHGDIQYKVLIGDGGDSSHLETLHLGERQYFLMSDNRGFYRDSRHWGGVHRSELIGRVSFLLLPRDWGRMGKVAAYEQLMAGALR